MRFENTARKIENENNREEVIFENFSKIYIKFGSKIDDIVKKDGLQPETPESVFNTVYSMMAGKVTEEAFFRTLRNKKNATTVNRLEAKSKNNEYAGKKEDEEKERINKPLGPVYRTEAPDYHDSLVIGKPMDKKRRTEEQTPEDKKFLEKYDLDIEFSEYQRNIKDFKLYQSTIAERLKMYAEGNDGKTKEALTKLDRRKQKEFLLNALNDIIKRVVQKE